LFEKIGFVDLRKAILKATRMLGLKTYFFSEEGIYSRVGQRKLPNPFSLLYLDPWLMLKILLKRNIGVVHIFSITKRYTSVHKISILRKFTTILTYVGFPKPLIEISEGARRYHEAECRFLYKYADTIDLIVAGSNYIRNLLCENLGLKNVIVIPNCIDTNKFKPLKKGLEDKPRIISVMRLHPAKAPWRIIDIIKYVIKEIPELEVHIYGEGVLNNLIKYLIHKHQLDKNIKLQGRVSHERMPDIYPRYSLYLHTSPIEALGTSVLEAMACGIPVLVPSTGGAKEAATFPELIYSNSLDASNKLLNLLFDEKKRLWYGKRLRSIAESMYSVNAVAKKYHRLYFRLL